MTTTRQEIVRKTVKIDFTSEQLVEMATEQARGYLKLHELIETKKSVASQYEGKIKAQKLELDELSRNVRNGYHFDDVDCVAEYDHDGKRVYFFTADCGLLVDERRMRPDELQMKFDDLQDDKQDEGAVVDAEYDAGDDQDPQTATANKDTDGLDDSQADTQTTGQSKGEKKKKGTGKKGAKK